MSGGQLSGGQLSGVNCRGVNCQGVNCRGVNCRGVNCRGVNCRPPHYTNLQLSYHSRLVAPYLRFKNIIPRSYNTRKICCICDYRICDIGQEPIYNNSTAVGKLENGGGLYTAIIRPLYGHYMASNLIYMSFRKMTIMMRCKILIETSFLTVNMASSEELEDVVWRGDFMSPIRNQASCGGCAGFGVLGALEWYAANVKGYGIPLSVQYIVDCSIDPNTGEAKDGCNGGVLTSLI